MFNVVSRIREEIQCLFKLYQKKSGKNEGKCVFVVYFIED